MEEKGKYETCHMLCGTRDALDLYSEFYDRVGEALGINTDNPGQDCDDKMIEKIDALRSRVERLEDALDKIISWGDAYPLDMFPEPDFEKARDLLATGGMRIDDISASNMRHVVKRVGEIAKEALK